MVNGHCSRHCCWWVAAAAAAAAAAHPGDPIVPRLILSAENHPLDPSAAALPKAAAAAASTAATRLVSIHASLSSPIPFLLPPLSLPLVALLEGRLCCTCGPVWSRQLLWAQKNW